ncbi:hypothetical protein HIM_08968 [Hirsutella minnesotensis 3608]|uniref:Uncharacterized protein n=1 Tax=Hirsutella minnesotensis 3608 TaxID=1043627 RepID=A0A0F7ZGX6_9HYPO|nr:hypothetical protein HIM_08968 [Hirsutella minnesotensis 3608]
MAGTASQALLAQVRSIMLSPHHVQMHLAESAISDLLMTRRRRPPRTDGHHLVQFRFDCQLFGPLNGIGDPSLVPVASLPAVTGTADDCVCTPVSDYTKAIGHMAAELFSGVFKKPQTTPSSQLGTRLWRASEENSLPCAGPQFVHMELAARELRMSVCARVFAMMGVFQQMCWTLATLSLCPFSKSLSECVVDVSEFGHDGEAAFIQCG